MARIARVLIAGATLLALLTVGTAAPGTSQTQARSTLKVTPGTYVAGQKMTFTGRLGGHGRKRIHLQFHMNRPGDRWTNVRGFSTRTDAAGRFRFSYPSPAMWGISYRVVSGRLATPAHKFHAKSQEVVLSVGGDNTAEAGDPFVVAVDTTPNLSGRQDLPPPAIPGRAVTLQQRVNSDRWQTVDTGLTDLRRNKSWTFTKKEGHARRRQPQLRRRGGAGPHHLVPRRQTDRDGQGSGRDLGVPLTLRLSLQGDGKKEMNRTRAMFDWMRAWPIDTGRRVTNGNRMKVGTHNATC